MLKTNHDSGGVVLVSDKEAFLNDSHAFKNAMKKLNKHLKTNYYKTSREWHYKDIEARVFAEEMLSQNGGDPTTYKFHIFGKNNKNNFIQVTTDRWTNSYQRSIFTTAWEKTPFGLGYNNKHLTRTPQQPRTLILMNEIAEILANPFDYVRVDLYEVDSAESKIAIVGELTWTPMGGTDRFYPAKYDEIFGNAWQLHTKDSK